MHFCWYSSRCRGLDGATRGASTPGDGDVAPTRDRAARRSNYGYTVWVPGLVLGLAYLAAALEKLRGDGLAWILNGTVNYHFLTDSTQAIVDWGTHVGRYHWLAGLLSFSGIAIETLVVVGVCSRTYRYRLIAGGAPLCLLLGFWLLQGIFWPGWWILLLTFLPWHLVRSLAASAAPATVRPSALAQPLEHIPKLAVFMVLVLVSQQLVVSLWRLEVSPAFSTYDMYATSYGSPAEYEANAVDPWIVGLDDAGQSHSCRISRADADTIAGARGSPDQPFIEGVLRRCLGPAIRLQHVSVEARQDRVNWAQWRLEEPVRLLLIGPIVLDSAP